MCTPRVSVQRLVLFIKFPGIDGVSLFNKCFPNVLTMFEADSDIQTLAIFVLIGRIV